MKCIVILCMLLTCSICYSNDRFFSEGEESQKILDELGKNLDKITMELEQLNERQVQTLKVLTQIAQIAEDHRTEKWEN